MTFKQRNGSAGDLLDPNTRPGPPRERNEILLQLLRLLALEPALRTKLARLREDGRVVVDILLGHADRGVRRDDPILVPHWLVVIDPR